MPKLKEPVGVIMRRPLPSDIGSHLLFISRPAVGPFSQAGTAIFVVDAIGEYAQYMEASSAVGPIAFSKDIPFLMIPRALCRPVSIKELAKTNIAEKAEWEKAYKDVHPEQDVDVVVPEAEYRPGNYA